MFFYTSETPFHKVENDFLRQAFQILGCNIPHRRELAGKLLEDAYNRVKARVDEDLARVCTEEALVYMALATDGWRKKAAGQGAPLTNVLLLMPNGGSIFLKVINTAGMRKNAQWVVDQHVDLAKEVTSGKPERLIGVLMDNTKTNLAAMKKLQEKYPTWLCLGCFAHGLALLIKDLAGLSKKQHAPAVASMLATTNTMANVINDCEAIRTLLHKFQVDLLGERLAVDVSVPTRFGSHYFVHVSMRRNERPIKAMLVDDEWDNVKGGSVNSSVFDKCRGSFWSTVQRVEELIKPVSDAIHQAEADRPLLSQLLRIYNTLVMHAKAWAARPDVPASLSRGVVAAFERRFELHYDPAWAAAFLVDPLFAVNTDGNWGMPFSELTSQQLRDAKVCITRFVGGGTRTRTRWRP